VGVRSFEQFALRSVDLLVDVGANVGQFAERARDLGFSGEIISYEPASAAYEMLARRASGDVRWTACHAALGSEDGVATLNLSRNSVSSSLLPMDRRHAEAAPDSIVVGTERVRLSTLDSELAGVPGGNLYLKLDVQGYELQVLEGASATLERVDLVRVEVSFDDLYRGQTAWLSLCNWLEVRGYVVRYVEPGYEDPRLGFMLQADLIFARRAWNPPRT
jgi:FkbM family methyltransferase